MNCQRFEKVVSELARGQMIEVDVRTDALVHSEACEKCAERFSHEQALTRALHALSEQLQTERAPDGLELELRRAFREQHTASQSVIVAHSFRRYWLAVAAAVLLVLGSIAALRFRNTEPAPPQKQIAGQKENSDPKVSPSPEAFVVDSSSQDSQQEPAVITPRRRQVAAARRTSQNRGTGDVATNHVREIATDFIPLGYSSDVNLQEGGQIVRVEVPRATLVKFGIPVNMDRLNEKVKADVWLGVDGLAHAIRFVQ
jgi:hypothetical protein